MKLVAILLLASAPLCAWDAQYESPPGYSPGFGVHPSEIRGGRDSGNVIILREKRRAYGGVETEEVTEDRNGNQTHYRMWSSDSGGRSRGSRDSGNNH
jgi:hypothetical protein